VKSIHLACLLFFCLVFSSAGAVRPRVGGEKSPVRPDSMTVTDSAKAQKTMAAAVLALAPELRQLKKQQRQSIEDIRRIVERLGRLRVMADSLNGKVKAGGGK